MLLPGFTNYAGYAAYGNPVAFCDGPVRLACLSSAYCALLLLSRQLLIWVSSWRGGTKLSFAVPFSVVCYCMGAAAATQLKVVWVVVCRVSVYVVHNFTSAKVSSYFLLHDQTMLSYIARLYGGGVLWHKHVDVPVNGDPASTPFRVLRALSTVAFGRAKPTLSGYRSRLCKMLSAFIAYKLNWHERPPYARTI